MLRTWILLVGCLLASLPARAEGLAYHWAEGDTWRYRVQLGLSVAEPLWFVAAEDLEGRVRNLAMGAELRCTAGPPARRRQEWSCSFEAIELRGGGLEGDAAKVAAIFAEYERLFRQATLELEWTRTGRLRTVDLEGIPKTTAREQAVHEYMRMLAGRLVSGLELELPGDDATSWRQGGSPLAFRLPTRFGTSGGVRLTHRVAGREGGLVHIASEGEATVTTGSALENDADETISMKLAGQAVFDAERGVLRRNDVRIQGVYSASRLGDLFLDQRVLVELLSGEEDAASPRPGGGGG